MAIDGLKSHLELLPTEIIRDIVDSLSFWDITELSYVSKRLRKVCLPSIFRRVKFEFSQSGLDKLQSLLESDARHHVVFFTYEAPELLKTGILDFYHFKSEILTPDSYVEEAKDLRDEGFGYDAPPYIDIYDSLHSMCEEQRGIIDGGIDLKVLSSTFRALPKLTDVNLSFRKMITEEDWLYSYFLGWDLTMVEKSYEHHIRVVSKAIRNTSDMGISIHTISLSGVQLSYYHPWQVFDWGSLSEILAELLQSIRVLRLSKSGSPLKLLSHRAIKLRELDMCCLVAGYTSLREFLNTNKKSIQSIGFHDVNVKKDFEVGLLGLTPDVLYSMLDAPPPIQCRDSECRCLPFWKKASRLLLNDGCSEHSRSSAKTKFDEV